MAEQTPINAGSSAAELVDGAPKDNVQEAPAEQAGDKKNGAPEMLKSDSADSSSASEKDSASGDDSSDKDSASNSASNSDSSSDKDSASNSASNSDSVSGDSSSKAVKKDKKKKKQIKKKFSKKSEEAVDVPGKALDDGKLECKSSDSDSSGDDSKSGDDSSSGDDSKSSDDSSGDSKSSKSSQDDKSKSKALEEEAQEKPIDGTGGDSSTAALVKQMMEEEGVLENVKGKALTGHHELTQGQSEA